MKLMHPGKLATYRRKRDFSRTTEPQGLSSVARSKRLRYVIQKHAARRLHWDLRLELDGVFKSWAITRGPSLDPADKRLAIEVEDHPLAYGDFEGTIPKGQYGAGSVQLWDRGYWEPATDAAPRDSLKAGELKFVLDGKRLHGGWVLVRMRRERGTSKHPQWLLIKHRDVRTKPAKPSARRAAGTRLPAFVEPQLCKLVDTPPVSKDWVHEIKLDGYRLQLRVVAGKATLKTRKGLDWTARFRTVAEAAAALPDCIIDGELCALDDGGRSSFSALQAALANGRDSALVFFAFDLLFDAHGDLRDRALLERKDRLQDLLVQHAPDGPIRYVEHLAGSGAQMWHKACEMKLEGVVSKNATAPYLSTRGTSWVKSKCRAGQEVVIGGYTSEANQLRSLLVGVWRDGQLRYAGRVGTGYGGDTSRLMLPRLKALASDVSPFHGETGSRGGTPVRWVKPLLVAEIQFAGWTADRRVRQAAFKGLRADKPAREVRDETPEPVEQAMAQAEETQMETKVGRRAEPAAKRDRTIFAGPLLSHPDKVLWPAGENNPAATKQDLAQYFANMADWILEHTRGRPCSLLRAPNGIADQQFFQRHAMAGHSAAVHSIKLVGDRKPYLQVDSVEALLAIAQMAGIELHPGNGQPGKPEIPGRLVFDLDPGPEVDFKRVIEGALELRERLGALGLESFCKTTGGKGLHVVAPLAPEIGRGRSPSWTSAKLFAQTLCAQMAAERPKDYLINMAKAARKGRIFLDYLRNDRLATAIAPLSPRAHPGATVSMPLRWSQVRKGLAPERFTIRTAPALLTRARPWQDYAVAARPLSAAARKLLSSSSTAHAA